MIVEIIDKNTKKIDDQKIQFKDKVDTLKSNEYLEHIYNRYVINKFRFSTASTKGRSEIAVTGAKAYRQKGTGNARRGRNSSPVRRGGAVAFGPKPRSFNFKLNKKVINQSQTLLLTKISKKIKILSNKITFKKTSEATKFLSKLNAKKIIMLITYDDFPFIRPFRNINNLVIDYVDYYEPELLLVSDIILFTENSFEKIKDA